MKLKDLQKKFTKQYGEGTAEIGREMPHPPRCPLGIFSLDLAIGGGIPLNTVTTIFGNESSGKTNLSLCAIREYQKRWPDRTCVFIDIEGTLQEDWTRKMGVNWERLMVITPQFAEHVIDMIDDLLQAEDIGLIVIDSIAAMAAQKDLEGTAETDTVGRNAMLVSRFMRKVQHRLRMLQIGEAKGEFPTLILINQIRHKVGVMFGSPETRPGGMAQDFAQTLRIRVHGKPVIDKDVNEEMAVRKFIKGTVQKYKCAITSANFEFEHVMVPHKGLEVGYAYDWPAIKKYTQGYGMLVKEGNVWKLCGEEFKKLEDIDERLRQDIGLRDALFDTLLGLLLDNPHNVSKGTPTQVA